MTFRVTVTKEAWTQAIGYAEWWAEHRSHEQAYSWLAGLELAIESLSGTAQQHAKAIESSELGYELHQLNYGVSNKPTHRILYRIKGNEVTVITVRHLAQDKLDPNQLS